MHCYFYVHQHSVTHDMSLENNRKKLSTIVLLLKVCLKILMTVVRDGENWLIQTVHGELAIDIRVLCYLRVLKALIFKNLRIDGYLLGKESVQK